MGSMIHLAVGRLEVDWGKNNGFRDHSALFQRTDLSQVTYWYVDDASSETGEKDEFGYYVFSLVSEQKDGLSKPLKDVVDRIRLQGFTIAVAEKDFEACTILNGADETGLSFTDLREALLNVDVKTISADYGDGGEDFGKFFRRYMAKRLGLAGKFKDIGDLSRISESMENISPLTILTLLAENPTAKDLPVIWAFADIEENGYEPREAFVKDLEPTEKVLIVTEGSSDANVIKHAFSLLMPHVADFFDYIDVNEGYPFTGTGSQFNFAKGLIAIAVQNRTVFLYDNDTEGTASLKKTRGLKIPTNIRAIKLPDLPEFSNFRTIGPSGDHAADINSKAAAIECYLDTGNDAVIRWTSYNKELDTYQGELVFKGIFAKRFYGVKSASEKYDFSKIRKVLELIISTCVDMREQEQIESYDKQIRFLTARSDED